MPSVVEEALSEGIQDVVSKTVAQWSIECDNQLNKLAATMKNRGVDYNAEAYLNNAVKTFETWIRTAADNTEGAVENAIRLIKNSVIPNGELNDGHHDISQVKAALRTLQVNEAKINAISSMLDKYTRLEDIGNRIRNGASQNGASDKDIILESYIKLNKIGEGLRGSEIAYEVNLVMEGGNKGITSGYFTLEQLIHGDFLKVTNSGTLKFNSSMATLLKNGNNSQYTIGKWSQERIADYKNFLATAKANETIQGAGVYKKGKVNLGNVMEAFRRGEIELLERAIPGSRTAMGNLEAGANNQVHKWMRETVRNTASFLTGGDLQQSIKELLSSTGFMDSVSLQQMVNDYNDLQLKNVNASITNLNSLYNQFMILKANLNALIDQGYANLQLKDVQSISDDNITNLVANTFLSQFGLEQT